MHMVPVSVFNTQEAWGEAHLIAHPLSKASSRDKDEKPYI